MVYNNFVNIDLIRCLDKLSLLNYIDFHCMQTKRQDQYVYVRLDGNGNYPNGLIKEYNNGRRCNAYFDLRGYGLATPFAAEVLMASPLIRSRLRQRLVEELKTLEKSKEA